MNTKMMEIPDISRKPFETSQIRIRMTPPVLLFICLLVIWFFLPQILSLLDETVGNVDQSIWLLILLSLITFLLIICLCWWLLQYLWKALALPDFKLIISQFNTLELWQQLSFFWASFFSLLLAAIGCLAALC